MPLFPEILPFDAGHLEVTDGHTVYYEQCGNPLGRPALFVHGGPGGATSPRHRRFFNPALYRVVLFDQRGCGRSEPHASLEANTTWHLVFDIERLRIALGIEAWLLFGGSWGSTLALAYAQAFPERVSALVLRGIFLLRKQELDWFYQDGASRLFPEAWREFRGHVPPAEQADLLHAYHRRLIGSDLTARLEAARAWCIWEKRTSYLVPHSDEVGKVNSDDRYSIAFARIEAHYFVNKGFFLHPNQLVDGLSKLSGKPAIIVQGRYDVVCPITTALEVHESWPGSELEVVSNAGHSAFELEISDRLVSATNRLAAQRTF